MTESEFTALPPARLRFIAIRHGSKNETAKGVPEKRQDSYYATVTTQTQSLAKIYANMCREFGGSIIDDVPAKQRNACKLALWEWHQHFSNRCEFELAIKRARDADDTREAAMDFG